MITTIIFDLSEVYLKGLLGTEKILEPILKLPAKDIYHSFKGDHYIKFFHGEISEDEFWESVKNNANWDISLSQLKNAVRSNFAEIEGTREIIEKLKIKGYKLGLLSVHAKEWIEYLEKKFDYHKLFHSTMYSFEVGISKPDKKSYELIIEKLGAKPEECLFIDDHEKNIIAAKGLGINAIHFKDSNQLIRDLNKFDIKI
ncbi:HAD family phosphatase [Candidatus Pacearchaeota archaeon]|nr:HAD family phosphatase [Candidatus Pacearchaeota archaeon]